MKHPIILSSLLIACSLEAQERRQPNHRPMPRPGIAEMQQDNNSKEGYLKELITEQTSTATHILVAKVTKVRLGMATMSLPPQCRNALDLENIQMLRGEAPEKPQIVYFYIGNEMGFKEGETRIFFGRERDGMVVYNASLPEKDLQVVKQYLFMIPGWVMENNQFISPWGREKIAWPKNWQGPKAEHYCALSGRPAYSLDSRLEFKVEQVMPEKIFEYQNPYGNGEFKITLKNPTKEKIAVPCLLKKGDTTLWKNSLILTTRAQDGHIFTLPIPENATYVTLAPGEQIETIINTLELPSVRWPNGGNRVYFDFCLGNRKVNNFFYYFSSLHDPMLPKKEK